MTESSLTREQKQRACEIVELVTKELPAPDNARTGVHCKIYVTHRGAKFRVNEFVVGTPDPEKDERYDYNSAEKALRLAGNPGDFSSWQTRNEDKKKWGGAIWGSSNLQRIYSLSGLPEHGDEASGLWMAIEFGDLLPAEALVIADYSENTLFKNIYLKFDLQSRYAASRAA